MATWSDSTWAEPRRDFPGWAFALEPSQTQEPLCHQAVYACHQKHRYVSCWEEKRRSLAFSDTHLGPLSHSLDICTLVPDTAEVRDQQDIASIPEAHFGKKSRLAKANRSPGLGQEAAFQLLGALHLQESNQVSASTPTQEDLVPGVTSQGPSVPAGPLMMQSHLTPQK